MHVKLEVETQPLSNLVPPIKKFFKSALKWTVLLSISGAWLYYLHELVFWWAMKTSVAHHWRLDTVPSDAWGITALIFIVSMLAVWGWVLELRGY